MHPHSSREHISDIATNSQSQNCYIASCNRIETKMLRLYRLIWFWSLFCHVEPRGLSFKAHACSDWRRSRSTSAVSIVGGDSRKYMTARRMETLKFLSGGVAGTVASAITNPLEVIKTQLQSSNQELIKNPLKIAAKIMEVDGVKGFWRGLPPTLLGIIPSRSAYFYVYQRSKNFLTPKISDGPANALLSGLLAGFAGNTLTNPIWMVRTRMQLISDHTAGQRDYTGYLDAVSTIWVEEGIGGFYKGISASYWGCAEGALQFLVYEQIKTRLLNRRNEKRRKLGLPPTNDLGPAVYFGAAAVSKLTAAVATYPHEVARTRMREQARAGVFKYSGMWQTLGLIANEEGKRGLYSGMGVHLLKVVPNSATMFLCYEIVRTWLDTYEVSPPK